MRERIFRDEGEVEREYLGANTVEHELGGGCENIIIVRVG